MPCNPSNPRRRGSALCGLVLVALIAIDCTTSRSDAQPAPDLPDGLNVTSVAPNGGGRRAGLRVGDILIRWERPAGASADAATGRFSDPWEWTWLEWQQKPLGAIRVNLFRDNEWLWLALPAHPWETEVRGQLDHEHVAQLREDRELDGEAFVVQALPRWTNRIGDLERRGERSQTLALRWEVAQILLDQNERLQAIATLETIREDLEPGEVRSWLSDFIGRTWIREKNAGAAEEAVKRAFEERKDWPTVVGTARYYHHMGHIARLQGDWQKASKVWRQAHDLLAASAPDSLLFADLSLELGVAAKKRHDYAESGEHYRESERAYARLAPGTRKHASVLYNLGSLARLQGRLLEAETYQKRSLSIMRLDATTPPKKMVRRLAQLAIIANDRKDYQAAESFFLEALKLAGDSAVAPVERAYLYNGLGTIYADKGNFQKAADQLARASELASESSNPEDGALIDTNLGFLNLQRKHYDLAADSLHRAAEGLKRGSGLWAYNLRLQSQVLRGRGDAEAALPLLDQALDEFPAESASGFDRAELLAERARCLAELNRPGPCEDTWHEAAAAYERQLDALGGNQFVQAGFFMGAADSYRNLVKLRAARGDVAAAFSANERFRGPILRRLMTGSPQQAQLQTWLDAEEVQARLDPGTLMLSYCVLDDRTFLFALDRENGLSIHALDGANAEVLERQIQDYRTVLAEGRMRRLEDLYRRGYRLFNLVLAPVQDRIREARRLLICPDGPLFLLPFSALVTQLPPEGAEDWRQVSFLAGTKPIHFALSGTLYSLDLEARGPQPIESEPQHIAAFGAALHTPALNLPELPQATAELAAIAGTFPDRTRWFHGEQATEAQVRSLDPDTHILHFAGHAVHDLNDPAASALIMTPTDRDDGKLFTWEIQERLTLQADLVVLSACETALGHDMGGEGLMGLTRSFQVAGARSVLATLWRVEDRATAVFMGHFYGYLQKGHPKDHALQYAQQAMMRHYGQGRHWAHPLYWAGFQLFGDWRKQ